MPKDSVQRRFALENTSNFGYIYTMIKIGVGDIPSSLRGASTCGNLPVLEHITLGGSWRAKWHAEMGRRIREGANGLRESSCEPQEAGEKRVETNFSERQESGLAQRIRRLWIKGRASVGAILEQVWAANMGAASKPGLMLAACPAGAAAAKAETAAKAELEKTNA